MRPGILVTGLPRSGTSWVGRMLQADGGSVYVNEPLNPSHPPGRCPGVLDASVGHRFEYICSENDGGWASAFADTLALRFRVGAELRVNRRPYDLARAARNATQFTLGRLRGRRALLDDPYALFASPWLAERFGLRAVILIREPVALVGAWQSLGWKVDARELLDQPLLMRDHLEPHRAELESVAGTSDGLAATAALWNVAYSAVGDFAAADDRLRLVRYEDLARDPIEQFRELYSWLGLGWSAAAAARVAAATGSGEAGSGRRFRWSVRGGLSKTAYRPMASAASLTSYRDRLSPKQIDRATALTERVRARFYDR